MSGCGARSLGNFSPISHCTRGQHSSELKKRTSDPCLCWDRTQLHSGDGVRLLDEAKDKCREKLHQNSGYRHSLEGLQPRKAVAEQPLGKHLQGRSGEMEGEAVMLQGH